MITVETVNKTEEYDRIAFTYTPADIPTLANVIGVSETVLTLYTQCAKPMTDTTYIFYKLYMKDGSND